MEQYRIYNIPDIKTAYVSLLGSNLNHLVNYIYSNLDDFPDPETRVALSFNMLLISGTLLATDLSVKVAKDLESLYRDQEYLMKWKNPSMKRQYLRKELETLRKHTEIDETVSLNMSGQCVDETGSIRDSIAGTQYDIKTGIETLNISASLPVPDNGSENGCQLM
jgi:hypothetical protein